MYERIYSSILGTAAGTTKAGKTEFKFAIATLSLIDPNLVSLPLMDRIEPALKINRKYITGNKYYRFANFLEAKIEVDDKKITSCGLTTDSGLYRDNSFLGRSSQAFNPHRFKGSQPIKPFVSVTNITADQTLKIKMPGLQGRRWVQTVGARTRTAEDIGEMTGTTNITNELALPPIWSTLRLSIYADGMVKAELLYHSLFPSVWFFVQDNEKNDQFNFVGRYEGSNDRMNEWRNGGFGTIGLLQRGSNKGNPWRMQNPHVLTR